MSSHRDVKLLASALGVDAAPEEIERYAQILGALERDFRPRAEAIPFETEPAVMFRAAADEERS